MHGGRSPVLFILIIIWSVSIFAQVPDNVRAWLHTVPMGTELRVTLVDGEQIEGSLAEATDNYFTLWVGADEETKQNLGGHRIQSVKRKIPYDKVQNVQGFDSDLALSRDGLAFRLRIGDRATVHTQSGDIHKGKIEDFDAETIRIDGIALNIDDDIHLIDRQESDSVKNGALIGFGIGAGLVALGCIAAAAADDGCPAGAVIGGLAVYGGAGAGLGALFDSFKRTSTTVYVAPPSSSWNLTIDPILSRVRKGLIVLFSF